METDAKLRLNSRGDRRGMHANSRHNLKPWKVGQSGNPKGRRAKYHPLDDSRFIQWLLRQEWLLQQAEKINNKIRGNKEVKDG